MNDDDLTPDERSAFADLPRERRPSDLLEERTVGALHAAGLLGARRRRDPWLAWPRAAAAAAVLALMAGSFAAGQRVGAGGAAAELRRLASSGALVGRSDGANGTGGGPASDPVGRSPAGPLATAVDVQRAGSAYIAALARLTAAPAGTDTAAALESREVAIATLLGAAQILARLDPRQPIARSLLAGLEKTGPAPADTTQASRRDIVWF